MMNHGCHKCCKATAWLVLIAGVLFLLGDMQIWSFWGLNWWTVLFIILGVTGVAKCHCKDCKKCMA